MLVTPHFENSYGTPDNCVYFSGLPTPGIYLWGSMTASAFDCKPSALRVRFANLEPSLISVLSPRIYIPGSGILNKISTISWSVPHHGYASLRESKQSAFAKITYLHVDLHSRNGPSAPIFQTPISHYISINIFMTSHRFAALRVKH